MRTSGKAYRILRRLILIITALLILVFITLSLGLQPYLNNHLSRYISEKTGGLYHFDFKKIELHFGKGGFVISDINLTHDKLIAEKIQAQNPDQVFYTFSSRKVQISYMNLWNYLRGRDIRIKDMVVVRPRFMLTGPGLFGSDSTSIFKYALDQLRPAFVDYANSLEINEINFIDASYQFFNLIGDTAMVSDANRVSVGISGFRTDTTLIRNTTLPFRTKDIYVKIYGFKNALSDSIHVIKIDSMEYSLKKAELKAFNSHLYPAKKTGRNSLYDVLIPEFDMRGKNLTQFHWTDSLNISYLNLKNPVIKFTQKDNPPRLKIEDINNFDLYKLVKNDFSSISIDSFYMQHARLKIFKSLHDSVYQQKFNDIGIRLQKFKLDSLSGKDPDKLFYASNIEMKIRGYELDLEDNLHRFEADSVFVSTFRDSLAVSGIKISPLPHLDHNAQILLNVSCRNVIFNDIDLKEIYHRRIIPGKKVEILNPVVSIANYPDVPSRNEPPDLFFHLVSAYLKGVYSNLIFIKNGSLNISNYSKGKVTDYYKTGFSFTLTDFSLDSITQARTDKFFYATSFDLTFSNYRMHLEDNLHNLDIKNIHILNTESKVVIDSLHLYPAYPDVNEEMLKKYNRSELYNISVPRITLLNTDLHRAFFRKDLNISNFRIENPSISYENFAMLKNKADKPDFAELYDLIFNYINDISIASVEVPSGMIKWVNHSRKGKTITLDNKFSTELKNFRLNRNEVGKQKLLFSEQLKFSLKDQLFKLSDNVHYLKADQIDFSTEDHRIVIHNALLYPDITTHTYLTRPVTYQLSVPQLRFDGVDLVSAYYSQKLEVDTIRLNHPKFEVYAQKDRIKMLGLKNLNFPFPVFLKSLHVKNLDLDHGQVITYQSDGVKHTQSSSFEADLNSQDIFITPGKNNTPTQIESGKVIARISNFRLILNDKSHEARFDEIIFNKQSKNITLKNFRLIPAKYGQTGNRFDISAPKIVLSGFDIDKAYQNNDYVFDKINVDSPDIRIILKDSLNPTGLRKLNNINLYDYLEPYLNTLSIGKFSLKDVSISLKTSKSNLAQKDINISLNNIAVAKNSSGKGILNSDGFELITFNYSRTSANQHYRFTIDTIRYSSVSDKLRFQSLHITPLKSKEAIAREAGTQTDVVNAAIRSAVLQGFDLDKWLNEQIIVGKKLVIGPANVNIFRNKRFPVNTAQRPPWPQQLPDLVKQPYEVDSIILLPSSIKYSELLETDNDPMTIDFTDVSARMGRVTNLDQDRQKKNKLEIIAEGKVLKKGEVTLTADFSLDDPEFEQHVWGQLGPVDMTLFNDIVEKNALLTIEQGHLNHLKFDFNANKNKATGELYFDYDQLKIGIMNYRKGDTIKSKLNSFMANSFVIHSKNPRGKSLEPQKINYQRDPSRSVLNYWWKAIYNSAKTVLGIKKEATGKQ